MSRVRHRNRDKFAVLMRNLSILPPDNSIESSPGSEFLRGERLHLHGANTLAFADVDGKGVLDLFWGDFFEQGLLRFENTGTCANGKYEIKTYNAADSSPTDTAAFVVAVP